MFRCNAGVQPEALKNTFGNLLHTRRTLHVCFFLFSVALFCFARSLAAEPQIKQFFPERPLLLGQQIYWIVEIRYPLWESYTIKTNTCDGAEIEIAATDTFQRHGEMVSRFRITVRATALTVSDTPSLLLVDEDGQSTTITGKPLTVIPISGDATDLKQPALSSIQIPHPTSSIAVYFSLILIASLVAALVWVHYRNKNPKFLFQRDLKRALAEVRRGRLPQQAWRLLRSDLLWGFPADAYTPLQLGERVGSHSGLGVVANTLGELEEWRYSGNQNAWDQSRMERTLTIALEIAGGRKKRPL